MKHMALTALIETHTKVAGVSPSSTGVSPGATDISIFSILRGSLDCLKAAFA